MQIVYWIITWLRRNYFFIFSLILLSLGFFIWIGLNPKSYPTESGVKQLYLADNISQVHARLIDEFNALQQDRIQVVPINFPFQKFSTNERKELLTRALRSKNNKLDIFAVDRIWLHRFAKWAEPLDAYFNQAERQQFLECAMTSCLHQNRLVGIPFYIDIGILYYRRDLLAKLPDAEKIEQRLQQSITWDDFIELGGHAAALKLPFYLFPADAYEGLMCCFIENLAGQYQSTPTDELLDLTTPKAKKALQLMTDLVNKHRLSPPIITQFKEIDVYLYALKENAVFFRGWPGNIRVYRSSYPQQVDHIGIAAMPHFAEGRPAATFGGWNLMVSRYSSKKPEAIEFLKFLSTKRSQETLYEVMGYLPTNASVYVDTAFCRTNPELTYLRRLLSQGVHRPAAVDYTRISDIITYSLHMAIKNEMSVEEALTLAQRRIRSQSKE